MLTTGIFANRWWMVFGAVLGLMVNTGVIEVFTFAVFLKPISEDLGIDRATLGLLVVIGSAFATLSTPTFGKCIDYFGLRRVHLPMIVVYAAVIASMSLLQGPFWLLAVFFILRGTFGAGQSPIAYSKAIAATFDKDRGLALGVAIAGVGIGVALMPLLANYLISAYGWREAFVGLGIAILVFALIPGYLFEREPPANADNRKSSSNRVLPGMRYREAVLHGWRFWAITIAFFLGVVAVNGTLTQVVAMLSDRGFSRDAAVYALSISGIALTIGRVVSGWLLDRMHGPYVACFFLGSAAIGITLLASGAGGSVPYIGTVLCGLGIGAEVDLMAFFISRYFGLRAFGAIYGSLFALFSLGNAVGPWLMGMSLRDSGSYVPMMIAFVVALGAACALLLPLGPYRYVASQDEVAAAMGEEAA